MTELTDQDLKLLHDLAYWGLGHVRQNVPLKERSDSYPEHRDALNKLGLRLEEIKRDQENEERLRREERERQELEQGRPVAGERQETSPGN